MPFAIWVQRYNIYSRYEIKKAFFDAESRKKVIFLRKVKSCDEIRQNSDEKEHPYSGAGA